MATNDQNKANTKGRKPLERDASPLSIDGIRGGTLNHVSVKIIMILLIVIFAVGFLITSFNPTAGINGKNQGPQKLTSTETVATVGPDSVERGRLETIAVRNDQFMEQYGQKTGPMEYFRSRQNTLQQLTNMAALIQDARNAGITVSDDDIKAKIASQIKDNVDNAKKSEGEANFRRRIESEYGSVEEFQTKMQTEMEKQRDDVEKGLLTDKLEKKIKDENKVTDADYLLSITSFKLHQIVIRPKAAGLADKANQDKYKADAKTRADKVLAELKKNPSPQNFAVVAKKESDDLMYKSKGGDLGWKQPAEMSFAEDIKSQLIKSTGKLVGPFADEATGEQHIFLVETRTVKYPKDYAKKKAELFKAFENSQDDDAWRKYQDKIGKAAKVDLVDPAFQAYKAQSDEIYSAPAAQQDGLRRDAVAKYETALASSSGLEAAAIRYQLSQLYRDLKDPKKAAEVLKAATEEVKDTPALDMEYARALQESGDKKGAQAELDKISKDLDNAPPAQPSMFGGDPNMALRYQLSAEYEALGRKDLAAKERAKAKPPAGMPGGMGMPGGGGISINPHR